jgi:hypothetical protein
MKVVGGALIALATVAASPVSAQTNPADVPHSSVQFNQHIAYCRQSIYDPAICQQRQKEAFACLHLAEAAGPTFSIVRGEMSIGATTETAASKAAKATNAPLYIARYAAGLVEAGVEKLPGTSPYTWPTIFSNIVMQQCLDGAVR